MTIAGSEPGDGAAGITDEALMATLANGDSGALSALYDRFGRLAYGLAYHMLGDGEAAEDVVQEAFVSVWRNATSFDPRRGSARAWLLTAVRNRCIDALRGPRRPAKLDAPTEAALAIESPDDVWETVLRNLQAQDVRRALDRLPEEQRTTIHLAFFGGLTHAQIAAHMRVPLGTVKGRMRLAVEKLREHLLTSGGMEPATEG
jgi:RNA polymerase sigma-70 factor (ECF subfamily)